jgi:HK97 family phage prohead protease
MSESEVLFRAAVLERVDADAGVIAGYAVPYEQPTNIAGANQVLTSEVISRHAFGRQANKAAAARVQLRWAHQQAEVPIGRCTKLEDREDGLWAEFQLTPALRDQPGSRAWEVHQSLLDGALTDLSVGFRSVRNRMDGDVFRHDRCTLVEVSVVPEGAYKLAKVASVRDVDGLWRESWLRRIAVLKGV